MIISDEQLMAYVDGELDDQQRSAVDSALARDASLAARLEQHRSLRGRLQAAHEPMLAEPVPSRLLALLQGEAPAGGGAQPLPFKPRAAVATPRDSPATHRWPLWSALAASVLVGVVAGALALYGSNQPRLELVAGAMVARGPLAEALNTQLAATQDSKAPVRLNLSYRNRAGAYCRVFSTRSESGLSGVACRRGSDWQLQVLAASPGERGAASAYRQAGSNISGAVLALVQSQMSGDPLDSEAEARAAQSGWR
jgi:hypothetical protein